MLKKSFNLSKFINKITFQNPLDKICDEDFIFELHCFSIKIEKIEEMVNLDIDRISKVATSYTRQKKIELLNSFKHELTILRSFMSNTINDCNKRFISKNKPSFFPHAKRLDAQKCTKVSADTTKLAQLVLNFIDSETMKKLNSHSEVYSTIIYNLKKVCHEIKGIK